MPATEYCMYLRKSRADLEAEARGEGDTLARHEHTLLDLARQQRLPIGKIYRELVSGERIANRPVMQQLLAEVEAGRWAGVLVTETSRLARGDTLDQGIVAQAFKYSHTRIVTPQKAYDPTNEIDEDWIEMGLFMARQEYRMIRRRQIAGTRAAKTEGRYTGNVPPYGYERVKLDRGWTLRPVPEQAAVVLSIFRMYLSGMGYTRIADRLNELQVPAPKGERWSPFSIPGFLHNPHYAGYIPEKFRPSCKQVKDGKLTVSRPRASGGKLYKGLHEAIVPPEIWKAAQKHKNATVHAPYNRGIENPLCGLIICDHCGRRMQRKPAGKKAPYEMIMCKTKGCPTVASSLEVLEKTVIAALKDYLRDLELHGEPDAPDLAAEKAAVASIEKEIEEVNSRIQRTFELVENGTYTKELFLARQSELGKKRAELLESKSAIEQKIADSRRKSEDYAQLSPRIRSVLDAYDFDAPAEMRNELLKQVLHHVEYHKTVRLRYKEKDDFSITLHPSIFYT